MSEGWRGGGTEGGVEGGREGGMKGGRCRERERGSFHTRDLHW